MQTPAKEDTGSGGEGSPRSISIILNRQAAESREMREAIAHFSSRGHAIEELLIQEPDDPVRLAAEAAQKGVDAVVSAGGDGTLNLTINGVFRAQGSRMRAVGIVPFGTGNDFALGCGIPKLPFEALKLIVESEPVPVDIGKVKDQVFLNLASFGFPAEVTTDSPSAMKAVLGGFAYVLTGLAKAVTASSKHVRLATSGIQWEGEILAAFICNGRQAGGGFQICPQALLDDGLFEVLIIPEMQTTELLSLADDFMGLTERVESDKIISFQTTWMELDTSEEIQVNLDGEPLEGKSFRFELLNRKLPFFLPPTAPLIGKEARREEGMT